VEITRAYLHNLSARGEKDHVCSACSSKLPRTLLQLTYDSGGSWTLGLDLEATHENRFSSENKIRGLAVRRPTRRDPLHCHHSQLDA